jgi:16S rRNA (guanine527-N7)-methyltransferase
MELHVDLVENEKSEFIRLTGAPHEAVVKLERYAELLAEWNQKFNLVAPSTLTHVWSRHFLDSAQLLSLISEGGEDRVLADLGSGAGFPGLVLSIMGVPGIHLIESTGKKANFLQTVIDDLKLRAIVNQCRVEELKDFGADIVTARALASLKDLLSLAARITKKDSLCLFLKGKNADVELTEARKCWMFDCTKTESLSDSSGTVLAIRNLKYDTHRQSRISRKK